MDFETSLLFIFVACPIVAVVAFILGTEGAKTTHIHRHYPELDKVEPCWESDVAYTKGIFGTPFYLRVKADVYSFTDENGTHADRKVRVTDKLTFHGFSFSADDDTADRLIYAIKAAQQAARSSKPTTVTYIDKPTTLPNRMDA